MQITASNFGNLGLELSNPGPEGAVEEGRASVDLQSAQDGGVNLVADFELDVGLVLLVGGSHLLLLLLGEFLGRDDLDILLLVQNSAVGDIGFDDFLQIGQPARFDDCLDELVGGLTVVFPGKTVEDLSLTVPLDCRVLKELLDQGVGLNDLAQVGQVGQDSLELLLSGC